MQNRKMTAALVSAALLVGVTGTTALAESSCVKTVAGAVYTIADCAKSAELPPTKVVEELQKAGVKDVAPTHWAAPSIVVLVQTGVLTPDAKGEIKPDAPISKNQTVAAFAKILGVAKSTDDATGAAQKAVEAGLVDAETAKSDRDMTRLEVAKLLAKALGIQPKAVVTPATYPFNDYTPEGGELSDEDRALLAALYEAGVFKGYPDKTFKPFGVLTKAEIAILIDRILGAQ